jgi:HAD superfamily hydrolase (TIGR01509 family)
MANTMKEGSAQPAESHLDLVIFDCDGVLVDSELLATQADVTCLAEEGILLSIDEVLDRYTGVSVAGMIADIRVRYGRQIADVGEFERRHELLVKTLFDTSLKPIPGVRTVLDALACKFCVASSSSLERIRHALARTGLIDRFGPHIYGASMVEHGKPAPNLFRYAAKRMGVTTDRCIVVEDSEAGITAAQAAGMMSIGFTGGSHCRPGHAARLREKGAIQIVDSMPALLATLTAAIAGSRLS